MKQYSFSAFLVDESNRAGFEICQDVVNLRPVQPMPVTLVGGPGSGKTHLLYAIVNRVRANNRMRYRGHRIDQAYVRAHDFPDPVRALIDNPLPVQRSKTAILLVDQLDQFDALVGELEGVVRVFLDNGHSVVLAGRNPPEQLVNLTPGLRDILEAGQVVSIGVRWSASQDETPGNVAETRVSEVEASTATNPDTLATDPHEVPRTGLDDADALRQALEAERASNAELREKLTIAKAYCESVQDELADTRGQLAQVRTELAAVAESERQLRAQQAQSGKAPQMDAEITELRHRLGRVHADGDQDRESINELVRRAEDVLAQIESSRRQSVEAEQDQQRQVRELQALLERQRPELDASEEVEAARGAAWRAQEELESLRAAFDTERATLENRLRETNEAFQAELALAKADSRHTAEEAGKVSQERDRLQKQLDEIQAEMENVQAEHERVRAASAEYEQKRGALETELDGLQQKFRAQSREMEALRQEAAGQVAEANAHAGEAERRAAALASQLADVQAINRAVASQIEALHERITEGARDAGQIAARLLAATRARQQAQEEEPPGQIDFLDYSEEPADVESDIRPLEHPSDNAPNPERGTEPGAAGKNNGGVLDETIDQIASEARRAAAEIRKPLREDRTYEEGPIVGATDAPRPPAGSDSVEHSKLNTVLGREGLYSSPPSGHQRKPARDIE